MRLDDDELLDSLMTFDMREVHHEGRPMRGTREYLVRVVLRLLAGDVQHGVYKFDFDKLSRGGRMGGEREEWWRGDETREGPQQEPV